MGCKGILWTLPICLVFAISLFPLKTSSMMAPKHQVRKRDSSGDENLRKELEKRAAAFTIDRFDSDPFLLQNVDTVNEKSTYKDPQTEQEYYERSASDKNKEAVVLTQEDDKIPITSEKRFYVVLRRSNLTEKPRKYYISTAYLVDPELGHVASDMVEHNGNTYAVEWAVWNDGLLQGFKYSFQFAVCRYSVLIACKPALPRTKEDEPSKELDPKKDKAETPKPEDIPVSEGFSPNKYSDFFRDLDNNKISGRFQVVGMVFDFLGGAVDGVGALWCGISSMVLGQCHQYDAESGYTKSQIGTPIVRSDGKILASGASGSFGSDGILGTIINGVFQGNKDVPLAMMNQVPEDVVIGKSNDEVVYLNPPGGQPQYAPPQYGGGQPQYGPPQYGGGQQQYGRKKRAAGPRLKGWRTQYAKVIEPNVIFNKDKDIFFGIGHCPPTKTTSSELYDAAKSDQDVIDFYVNLMRNGCLSRIKAVIPALKADGILAIKDKHFSIVPGNNLLNQTKLTWIEEQKLCTTLELFAISEAYKESKQKPDTDPKSPNNKKITNSIKFIEKFSLIYISTAKTTCTKHYIRLLRHLVQILRSAFGALREDLQNLGECVGDCSKDKEIVENDQFELMSIMKFVMHGIPYKGDPVYPLLTEFVNKNQAAIETSVKETV